MKHLDIFEHSQALLKGHFLLTSGLHSNTYFQCAKALQYPSNLTLLCKPIADHFSKSTIDIVISPALGGIVVGTEVGRLLNVKTIFSERANGIMMLRRGFTIEHNAQVLIVEDVVTTGGSINEVMKIVTQNGAIVSGIGFIVDRSNGTVLLSPNQFSLIKIEVSTYTENECPMCKAGSTPIKPGSR